MAATLMLALPARADITKAQCVNANADAQSLRQDGKFADAREQLRICSDPKCPALVVTDCTKRMDELEAAQPSIVFDVKDGAGADLTAVKVTVDGKVIAEKIDGSALRADPGPHLCVFEAAGQPPVTQSFVLKEGDKKRHEKVVIGAPPVAPIAPVRAPEPPPPAPQQAQSTSGWSTMRTLGVVLGGAGVAGIATGAVFGLMANSAWSNAQNECGTASNCTRRAQALSDHDTTVTDATISTIGFIAGGALVAGGAVMFFLGGRPPSEAATPAQTSVTVAPAVGPRIAGLQLTGRF
jgi:hypothetical protein